MRNTAITTALITKLQADATLMALTPDGVFRNVSERAARRFVIVSLMTGTHTQVFGRRGYLQALYLVEARMLSTAGGNVNDAAARIDALLDPQPPDPPATLTIPGWGLMALYQEEPIEGDESDDADTSILWHRAGGQYSVWAAPLAT